MYKTKFRAWCWRKNITHELAVEAARKRARREEEGRPASVVLINGKEVPDSRIKRHVKKHKVDLGERLWTSPSVQTERDLEAPSLVVTTPINAPAPPAEVTVAETPEFQSMLSFGIEVNRVASNFNPMDYGFSALDAASYGNANGQDDASSSLSPRNLPKTYQPIHLAALNGHTKIANILLKASRECADLEGEAGETALFLAAQEGHTEIVELLLAAGANPHACGHESKRRAIHQAAEHGHLECVRLLLSEGARVDEPDCDGLTPFMTACMLGFVEVVRLILSERRHTPVVNSTCLPEGRQPLHLAAHSGHLLVVQLLLDAGAFVDQGDEAGATALRLACDEGYLEVAEWLVKKGADVNNATLVDQRRPIHQAAQNGNLKIVQFLQSRGADITSGEVYEASPLFLASQEGHTEVVKFLLKHTADPNWRGMKTSRCPLHQAAQGNHVDVATALIRHGADVNAVEEDGWPPLMVAAQQGNKEMVQLLVDNGAAIDLANHGGATALWIAAHKGHLEIVKMLLEMRANPTPCLPTDRQPIHQAAHNGHLKIVQLLVARDSGIIDCQELNDGGPNITPLWLASHRGHDDIVEFLLEKGASPVVTCS